MKREAVRKRSAKEAVTAPADHAWGLWIWAAAIGAALAAVFWAYSPAVHGPFVFDDNFLPIAIANLATEPLANWMRGVRPVLMLTYWANARASGSDPWSYHVVNVLIHCAATGLVFLVARRLLERAKVDGARRDALAGLGAVVFLLHPIQTEAVAYLAGRSEALSVMFALAAFAVFLCRKDGAISWGRSVAVLALFGAAVLSKEQTVALPALLLLTDWWWNPGARLRAIGRNWRLYAPMAAGAMLAVFAFRGLILHATSAGFGMKGITWYEYFFTQCRALFVYMGEFVLPVRLTADWDFPISRSITEHGAIFGVLALVGLVAAAWIGRRRAPLAGYGFLAFLTLMAPTSSILPIADPIAERRIYFSMIGLLLVVLDGVSRLRIGARGIGVATAVLGVAAAGATYARAAVWADPVALWEDNVAKSPGKARGHYNLGFAYYAQGRPELAIREFEKTAQLEAATPELLLDWGLAYDALNRSEAALEKLRESAALKPGAHVYSQIGMVYGKLSQWPEALAALEKARNLDPGFAETYVVLGKVYLLTNQVPAAVENYQRALALDPTLSDARHDLAIALGRLRAGK
jgi:tetratricopeptide (TPR) repeat protein